MTSGSVPWFDSRPGRDLLALSKAPRPWTWDVVRPQRDRLYGDDWLLVDRQQRLICAAVNGFELLLDIADAAQNLAGELHEDVKVFGLEHLPETTENALDALVTALAKGANSQAGPSP